MITRYLFIGLLLIGYCAQAQDPDGFVIDFGAFVLDDEPDIFSDEFNFTYTGSYPLSPISFETNTNSYWEPVNMSAAVAQRNMQQQRAVQMRPVRVRYFELAARNRYTSDGQTKVQNTVYQDMRGLQLIDPRAAAASGLCWRCSPFRSNWVYR